MTLTEIAEKGYKHADKIGAYDCPICTEYCPTCKYWETCNSEYKEPAGSCDDYICIGCNGTRKTPEQNIIAKLREEVEEFAEAVKENDQERSNEFEACFHMQIEGNENEDKILLCCKKAFEKCMKNTTGDELADIIITALSSAKKLGIDIDAHVIAKLQYNEVREDHK
jgi:NTP pyrophosphatase (non-canonical NTP hydrolase)